MLELAGICSGNFAIEKSTIEGSTIEKRSVKAGVLLPPASLPPAQFVGHFRLLIKSALKKYAVLLLRHRHLPNKSSLWPGTPGPPRWKPDDTSSPISCSAPVFPSSLTVSWSLPHISLASHLCTFALTVPAAQRTFQSLSGFPNSPLGPDLGAFGAYLPASTEPRN